MNIYVRTRFAPSPTGLQHPGTIRTALFGWLLAKNLSGKFIVRLEDTDKIREVDGAEQYTYESLRWLGLEWDEGPDIGGEFGPYKQSDRLEIYLKYAQELIDKGLAYADPYTKEEVDKFRAQSSRGKKPFLFRYYRPKNPPEWKMGLPLRFKIPQLKRYEWQDGVHGKLSAGPEALDDFIIIKSDGYPTYNFAHVVDDHLMKISHVLRGAEFIASIPKYLAVYEALGWTAPINATMPLVLGKDGGKKLSKRDGALPILEYKKLGYLPEAINNFLATLGWNDGTEQEIFSIDELIEKFSLERIQTSPARFELERLNYLNGIHIRRLSVDELAKRAQEFWKDEVKNAGIDLHSRILEVEQSRLKTLGEVKELPDYFFEFQPPQEVRDLATNFSQEVNNINLADWLSEVTELIKTTQVTDKESLMAPLKAAVSSHSGKAGVLFSILRIILCNNHPQTPPIWEVVYVLGQTEALMRLDAARKMF